MHNNYNGDDRFYNNIFAAPSINKKASLAEENKRPTKPGPDAQYNDETMPLFMDGNLYLNGALPHEKDSNPMVLEQETVDLKVIQKEDGLYLEWTSHTAWTENLTRELVNTEMLGRALIPDMKYEHADGSPIAIDTDYFVNGRNKSNPTPGPFTELKEGKQLIKVWPK